MKPVYSTAPCPKKKNAGIQFSAKRDRQSFTAKYKDKGIQCLLYIPPFDIQQNGRFILHSKSAANLQMTLALEKRSIWPSGIRG